MTNQEEFRTKHMPVKGSADNQHILPASAEIKINNDTESVRFCTSPIGG
jgi:hypothetical protein